MESQEDGFLKKKKLLMQINSGELNKSILYYINEARTSPKDFSRHLISEDDNDEDISKLSLFFKNFSMKVPPLELDQSLELTAKDLIYSIILVDDGSSSLNFSENEKIKNNLYERLKKYNLMPVHPANFFIIGVDNAIEALANIFLNKAHRDKILSPEMRYVGIASELLPSERLCIVIDMVNSFRNYNIFLRKKEINYNQNYYNNNDIRPTKLNYIRFTNLNEDEDNDNDEEDNNSRDEEEDDRNYHKTIYYNNSYFNNKYNSDKKRTNNIKYFNSVGATHPYAKMKYKYNYDEKTLQSPKKKNNKKDSFDLRISKQTYFSPTTTNYFKSNYYYEKPKRFKMPMSVSIEKKYNKNRFGEIYPIYSKKTFYDDGSILIQPYFCEDDM